MRRKGRINYNLLQSTCTTCEMVKCHLKMDLYSLKMSTANSRATSNKILKRSIIGILKQERRYNHKKCSIKTREENRFKFIIIKQQGTKVMNRKQLQVMLTLTQLQQESLSM